MLDEIIEAVEKQFDDEESVADCFVWLNKNLHGVNTLPLDLWFDDHERCRDCGEKLIELHRTEWHPEVQCLEQICEMVCPNCGE